MEYTKHTLDIGDVNMAKYLWPRPYAWTQNFGTEATLASAIEANFAP